MHQAEFARLADLTPKLVSTIIAGKNPITADTAVKLERVLGMRASMWTGLQARWDLHQARERERVKTNAQRAWLNRFPLRELKSRGVLPETNDEDRLLESLLSFLGIGAPGAFTARIASLEVHHRQSRAHATSPHHVVSWLLLGELKAQHMKLPRFNLEAFGAAVRETRALTLERPEIFEPRMKEICRDAGVAVIFEKPIPQTCLFGSTRWLEGKHAIIQMSLRMKSNDHFWWTFFHESAHVILHSGSTFVDDQGAVGDEVENEADAWAEDTLVGRDRFADFKAIAPRSERQVLNFAEGVGIHPGIVVGMLQHAGIVPFRNLNGLKVRFTWADEVNTRAG